MKQEKLLYGGFVRGRFPGPIEDLYGPYESIEEALEKTEGKRYPLMPVGIINDGEYQFKTGITDADLVRRSEDKVKYLYVSGAYEITGASNSAIVFLTGAGTITVAASFTDGMAVTFERQDSGVHTLGFAVQAVGTNTGTKIDAVNHSATLIKTNAGIARIGELST